MYQEKYPEDQRADDQETVEIPFNYRYRPWLVFGVIMGHLLVLMLSSAICSALGTSRAFWGMISGDAGVWNILIALILLPVIVYLVGLALLSGGVFANHVVNNPINVDREYPPLSAKTRKRIEGTSDTWGYNQWMTRRTYWGIVNVTIIILVFSLIFGEAVTDILGMIF